MNVYLSIGWQRNNFGRDKFEYIWCNIHLDCQLDPGNKLVDLDVIDMTTENDDGEIVPDKEGEEEEEEKEDLLEDEKMRREREQQIKDTYVPTPSDNEDDLLVDYKNNTNNNDGRDIELWYQRAKL